jgi:hypothetical protein
MKEIRMSTHTKEHAIVAEIVTIEGGRCTFRAEGMDRDMVLPVDRNHVHEMIDDLIQAGLSHEKRRLTIRGGIIRGVEK